MREIELCIFWRACLKRRMNEQVHQNAASVVDEIAKSLGNQNGVDVARSRLLQLIEIVIGQGLVERDFDRG